MRSEKTPLPKPEPKTTGSQLNELEEFLAQSLFEMIVKKINPHDPDLIVINQSPKN